MKQDSRIDAYIDRQAEFARPILAHLRAALHDACPDLEETLKWSAPAFLYKNEILAMMAAFKGHAVFNLWRGGQVVEEARPGAMGQFGRIESLADLPDAERLQDLIRKAMALTDAGVKPLRKDAGKTAKAPVAVPEDLAAALRENAAAAAVFESFSPSARREYAEWVTEAKRSATRASRIEQAIAWIGEGKKRNWKYEKC